MAKKIVISGTIGFDVTAEDIRKQLKGAKDVDVDIASPGGSVFPGIEIFNIFKNHNGFVHMHFTGLVGSMASYIALAGSDKPTAESNAIFFIHNARAIAAGDQNTMKKTANILESISNIFAKAYAIETGKPIAQIKKLMDNETFFFGNEIKKFGIVEKIVENEDDENKEDALLMARMEIDECMNKIKMDKKEVEQIAALITPEKPTTINASVMENYEIKNPTGINIPETIEKNNSLARVVKADIPASAGENNREVIMTLKEFLDQNPAANAEYKEAIAEAEKAGAEEVRKRSEQASKYLKAESQYPEAIKNLAVDVINGKSEITALTAAVAAYDGFMENQKSKDAQLETDNQGDIPAGGGELPAEDGTISNEVDLVAAAAADRKKAGLEAN